MLADHLLALGHRRIALVGAPAHSAPVRARVEGALARMAEVGVAPLATALGPSHDFDACRALAASVLEQEPTAILGTTDTAAIGAIHAAIARGLRVPQDLAVLGFDDLPAARYVLPALTTVAQPLREIGEAAVAQLIARMQRLEPPPLPALPLRLVRRDTT